MLPSFEPMRLAHLRQPFDHKDWLFELKYDGFRALAYVENGSARLVSRKHNAYKSFDTLCTQIVHCLKVLDAILDGEVVCLGKDGRPRFHDLLHRRSPQYFYAFDLLWLNGRDLRELPLIERKRLLRRIIPKKRSVLFAKHIEATGVSLFHAACKMDLEGIIAKWKSAPYRMDGSRTSWVKIKNPNYSQAEGRRELFEKSFTARHKPLGATADCGVERKTRNLRRGTIGVGTTALPPRNKAGLIHHRRDWKTFGSGVEDDQFDALYNELIPTVWTVQADELREFQLSLANPPAQAERFRARRAGCDAEGHQRIFAQLTVALLVRSNRLDPEGHPS